ncbi:MAG: glycogen/starch/alpha-glucan phosphorylase [Deltaproteobacteria bacterium]|nr:glycogen/starch/alpha-glucan phosphorylase [Deltaproteobacteria bacterium]
MKQPTAKPGISSDWDVHFGLDAESIKRDFLEKLFTHQAKFREVATPNDNYLALSHTVRDRLLHRWIHSAHTYFSQASRTVAYLSAEFLIGPQLGNNLISLGIWEPTKKAMADLGLSLEELLEREEEPGLGNGGLGRLAACFLDSLATLEIPAMGYGIRYEFGIFDQAIKDGWQVEVLDHWLHLGYPWEIAHPEIAFRVGFGGHTEHYSDEKGRYRVRWKPEQVLKGFPNDTPILGHRTNTANMLRLWQAQAYTSLDLQAFNVGDYRRAVEEKALSENITKILYPNDESEAGKLLRLQQQYFFISCSLQDMIRIYLQHEKTMDRFHEKFAIQLNDTHPSLTVAELMRILVDEKEMPWETAWEITTKTLSYTNHTLMPEALETWPLRLMQKLLPRHVEIIFEINRRFLNEIHLRYPSDKERIARMSIIDERGERRVRMAHLATVGCHAVNGVAKLHSDLLRQTVLRDFAELWPEKFSNKTNGITPRRFLMLANPGLCALITEAIGETWMTDLQALRGLEKFANDAAFAEKWRKVKLENKRALAKYAWDRSQLRFDPESMFDVQVKRIHEYKRQHLCVLHAIALYRRLKLDTKREEAPRTILFGGKAAPGYRLAKLIIKLIHSVGEVINNDREMQGRLRVIFLPDLNVKNAQRIYPAADLSEQISTAGKEASGTGNMKFALNGALTIGTLDGANVEIREEVGKDNFFLFGLTAEEVVRVQAEAYRPREILRQNEELAEALELLRSGFFSRGDHTLFAELVDNLLERDEFMLLSDFASYVECQSRVSAAFRNTKQWTRMSILNTARMGKFSSDRAIREYCNDIWKVEPVRVVMNGDVRR